MRFKNYKPADASLAKAAAPSTAAAPSALLRTQMEAVESRDRASVEARAITLAPKKDTWDLKRDLSRKLTALDKITDDAIRDLLRAKAAASATAAAASSSSSAAAASASSGST
jgi:hypothetical protein